MCMLEYGLPTITLMPECIITLFYDISMAFLGLPPMHKHIYSDSPACLGVAVLGWPHQHKCRCTATAWPVLVWLSQDSHPVTVNLTGYHRLECSRGLIVEERVLYKLHYL